MRCPHSRGKEAAGQVVASSVLHGHWLLAASVPFRVGRYKACFCLGSDAQAGRVFLSKSLYPVVYLFSSGNDWLKDGVYAVYGRNCTLEDLCMRCTDNWCCFAYSDSCSLSSVSAAPVFAKGRELIGNAHASAP